MFDHKRGRPRADVYPGITRERILASCSIPLVYPWTEDEQTQALYWDGALVANTPLGAALDLMGGDVTVPAEIVIVMMTPWGEGEAGAAGNRRAVPKSFGDAITWMLDWMLLASFRETLHRACLRGDDGGEFCGGRERKPASSFASKGFPYFGYVKFCHLQEGIHHPLGLCFIRVVQHVAKYRGGDLPG
ncbi:MAG: hypothetical protein ACOYYJ_15515 [Chloroflexota bacterium]